MKRISLLLLFSLVVCITISAQQPLNRLVGIWQQYQEVKLEDGSVKTLHLPVWKVLQSDGRFSTFLIASQDGTSIITNEGTFSVISDTNYKETVQRSIVNQELVGKENMIKYDLQEDRMIISYRMPGAKKDGHEIWQRVKMQLP